MIGIYAIKNLLNDKYYIGQSLHVERRWIEHKSSLNNNRHANKHLQFSWNKYGSNNFEFMLLEECLLNELDEKEKYWISTLNAFDEGYNLDLGGQGILSYKHTDNEIDKMRRIQNPLIVLQFDSNHNLIKEWIGGSSHIHKELGYTKECIDACCNHTRKSKLYKDCYWLYKDEYYSPTFSWDKKFISKTNIKQRNKRSNNKERKINKFDMNMNYICTYNSITDAANDIGVYTSNIAAVLSGKRKSCSKYKWQYA